MYVIDGKKHIFLQSFQFDERRWQRTYTPRYQIDTTVVCARLAFEGMQALCYSHWRVCSGAVCLPISTTTKMFFPLLKVEIHIWLEARVHLRFARKGERAIAVRQSCSRLRHSADKDHHLQERAYGEGGVSGRMERGHVVLPDP